MTDLNTQANSDSGDEALQALLPPKVIRQDSERAEAPRTRRRTSLGGARLKLAVNGSIPGYHLYWCNDDNNELHNCLEEGFQFVTHSEVGMDQGIVVDQDVGDRVSKYVGTKANGDPMRAYLLKVVEEIWEDIQAASQEQANEWDGAILAGAVSGVDNRYDPKGTTRTVGRLNKR